MPTEKIITEIGVNYKGKGAAGQIKQDFQTIQGQMKSMADAGKLSTETMKELEKGFSNLHAQAGKMRDMPGAIPQPPGVGGGGRTPGYAMAAGRAGMATARAFSGPSALSRPTATVGGLLKSAGPSIPVLGAAVSAMGGLMQGAQEWAAQAREMNVQLFEMATSFQELGGVSKKSQVDIASYADTIKTTRRSLGEIISAQQAYGSQLSTRARPGEIRKAGDRAAELSMTGIDIGMAGAFGGRFSRFFGGQEGGRGAMSQALAGTRQMTGGMRMETLQAFGSIMEDAVSRGVLKGTEGETRSIGSVIRAVAGLGENFKGSLGGRYVQGFQGAFTDAASMQSESGRFLAMTLRQDPKLAKMGPFEFIKHMENPENLMSNLKIAMKASKMSGMGIMDPKMRKGRQAETLKYMMSSRLKLDHTTAEKLLGMNLEDVDAVEAKRRMEAIIEDGKRNAAKSVQADSKEAKSQTEFAGANLGAHFERVVNKSDLAIITSFEKLTTPITGALEGAAGTLEAMGKAVSSIQEAMSAEGGLTGALKDILSTLAMDIGTSVSEALPKWMQSDDPPKNSDKPDGSGASGNK